MNRIKQLREEFNITQIQLAKKMNKTQQTISLYEKGTNEPDLDGYILLSKLFNCSVEYVAGKSDVRNPEEVEIDPLDLAKFGFSLKNYEPLSEKQKEQVRDLLKVVLKDNLKDKEKKDEDK